MRRFLFILTAVGITALVGCATVAPSASQSARATLSTQSLDFSSHVNQLRASKGRRALKQDATLDAVAAGHAKYLAKNNLFSHYGAGKSTPMKRMKAKGYRACYAAENIAKGQPTQAAVMQAWANSPAHYKNLMSNKSRSFGAALVGDIWVMVFAKPC